MLVHAARDAEHLRILRELGLKSYMIVPMIASGRTLGAISLISSQAERRYGPEDLVFAEALAGRAALAVENARLYRHAQKLNAELEQRVIQRTAELQTVNQNLESEIAERVRAEKTIRSLLTISEKLNSTLNIDKLLNYLAQEATKMVNAEQGCAGLRTAEGMVIHRYFKGSEVVPMEYTWPPGRGLPGWVLVHKVPYVTNDPQRDPQIIHELSINVGVRSAICTPILDAQGEVIGFFDIHDKQGEDGFTASDQEILVAVSQVAAIAIQNALAYRKIQRGEEQLKYSNEQLRRLSAHLQSAREEERTRIAREIHDELGQVLTALKMDLSLLGRKFAAADTIVPRSLVLNEIKSMSKLIDHTIQSIREIIVELRPEMLDDLGLKAAIEWQVQEFQSRTHIPCRFDTNLEEIDLDHERSMAVFRILQESLTNVARHANATNVAVNLTEADDSLLLEVRDNGRGITPSEMEKTKSFGILGMQERALLLGGEINIQGSAGQGTMVSLRVPLAQLGSIQE